MSRISICFFALLPAIGLNAQAVPSTEAELRGTVSREQGRRPVADAFVALSLADAKSASAQSLVVKTNARGEFAFEHLPVGTYQVCAQLPDSDLLNSCIWSTGSTLTLKAGSNQTDVVLSTGHRLRVQINDGGSLLDQHVGRSTGANVLVGIAHGKSDFLPALQASRSATARQFEVVVPFETPLRLLVYSSFFQLRDAESKAVDDRGYSVPINISRTGTPSPITVTVGGVRAAK